MSVTKGQGIEPPKALWPEEAGIEKPKFRRPEGIGISTAVPQPKY